VPLEFGSSILGVALQTPEERTVLRAASPVGDWPKDRLPTRQLRLVVEGPLTDSDAARLAEHTRAYSEVTIALGMRYTAEPFDIGFLRHFPFLHGFSVNTFDFSRFEDFNQIPAGLKSLSFKATPVRKGALRFLRQLTQLQTLFLEWPAKESELEPLNAMRKIRDLTLRSISLTDLSLLKDMRELRSFDLKLGGTRDLRLLGTFPHLRYLEIWLVKGLDDLAVLVELRALQYLFLQSLKQDGTSILARSAPSAARPPRKHEGIA
jgi:hypothetical protein